MKKQHFSLVELLVVIAIIAVLAGMLIPAINGMKEKARATKARSEMSSIKLAILSYESTYGVFPFPCAPNYNGDIKLDTNNPDDYDRLIGWLTLVPPLKKPNGDRYWAPGTCQDDNDVGNPVFNANLRRVRFLDPVDVNGGETYKDPWSKKLPVRYVILLDANYDGQVTITGIPNIGDTSSDNRWNGNGHPNSITLKGSVFIYSYGPNNRDDYSLNNSNGGAKKYVESGNTYKTDDVNSWDK